MALTTTPYKIATASGGSISPGGGSAQTFTRTRSMLDDGITTKELESEVFEVAVERLLDLWQTRYGDEWVDIDALSTEPFYALVYKRLKAVGRIETHYLTDRARFVCRKPT
jgi:hypothetical protein